MWFLSWIPVLGPIIDGFFGIANKALDLKAVKYRVDGSVDIESIRAASDIIESTKDDIGVRLARDIICFPVAIWSALVTWDTIMAYHSRELMWKVAQFPPSVAWLPLAVMTFLLGNLGFNIWRRR